MASLANITLAEPVIPLVSTIDYDELQTTKIEHRWTTSAGAAREAKMYLPVAPNGDNKELLLYVIDQFIDATDASRLNITVGSDLYTKFRAVLNGDLRILWQALSDTRNAQPSATPAVPDTHTVENFKIDVQRLIGQFFSPTSFEDQKEYLRNVQKPYSMSCEQVGSRMRVVSALGRFLPGSNNQVLYPTEDLLKRAYFHIMLQEWKIKFAESGHVLDGAYTYVNLIRFMAVQEAISKTRRGQKRRDAPYHSNSHGQRQRRYIHDGHYGRNERRGGYGRGGGHGGGGSPGGGHGGGRGNGGYSPYRGRSTPYRSSNRHAGRGGYYSGGFRSGGRGGGHGGGRGYGGYSSPSRRGGGGSGPRSPPAVPRGSPGSTARGAFGDGHMMDDTSRQGQPPAGDHYYQEPQEQEHHRPEDYSHQEQDQYFAGEEYDGGEHAGYPEEHYYGGDGDAPQDGHWMGDFGF